MGKKRETCTVKGELIRLRWLYNEFARVAFVHGDAVLSVFEGPKNVDGLIKGKYFNGGLRFSHHYILGDTIVFFLSEKEAKLCSRTFI